MRITLAQVEAFYWTVQLGSAQKAAQHLNLAQPSISLRLKDLRRGLGCRIAGAVKSRPGDDGRGRMLLPRVKINNGGDTGHPAAGFRPCRCRRNPCRPRRGLCRQLPGALCWRACWRIIRPWSPSGSLPRARQLEASLLDDKIDVAVLLNPLGHEKLTLKPLGPQPTHWVAPASWDVRQSAVEPKDLGTSRSFRTRRRRPCTGRSRTGLRLPASSRYTKISICTSVAVIPELVAAGLGAGIPPTAMALRYARRRLRSNAAFKPENRKRPSSFPWLARTGVADQKIIAVERTTSRVLKKMRYLENDNNSSPPDNAIGLSIWFAGISESSGGSFIKLWPYRRLAVRPINNDGNDARWSKAVASGISNGSALPRSQIASSSRAFPSRR